MFCVSKLFFWTLLFDQCFGTIWSSSLCWEGFRTKMPHLSVFCLLFNQWIKWNSCLSQGRPGDEGPKGIQGPAVSHPLYWSIFNKALFLFVLHLRWCMQHRSAFYHILISLLDSLGGSVRSRVVCNHEAVYVGVRHQKIVLQVLPVCTEEKTYLSSAQK